MFVVFCVNVICSSCKGKETKRAWRFSKMGFYCNIIYTVSFFKNIFIPKIYSAYMQFVYFIIYLLFFALLICLTNLSNEVKVHHLQCTAGGDFKYFSFLKSSVQSLGKVTRATMTKTLSKPVSDTLKEMIVERRLCLLLIIELVQRLVSAQWTRQETMRAQT